MGAGSSEMMNLELEFADDEFVESGSLGKAVN